MKRNYGRFIPVSLNSSLPVIEMTGNNELTIEGSTGVLKYEKENIKVNTRSMVVSVKGRNLKLKYISASALIIEGIVLCIEFVL